jgi:hypothetical protein
VKKLTYYIILSLITGTFYKTYSQISTQALSGTTLNPITTSVPFLLITPDSKHGAMGDAGVADNPDANSMHWNVGGLAFAEKDGGVCMTITPWLRTLVPDINLYYLSGFWKIKKTQAIGASLRYFTLGNIQLTDIQGNYTGDFKPNEFAIDVGFSQKLSKTFALGVAGRFINSGISRVSMNNTAGNAASTAAVDIGLFYRSSLFKLGDKNADAGFGLLFSNLGAKIRYVTQKNFIPMNMRLGGILNMHLDDYNVFSILADVNKLLVPTPPIYEYEKDSNGNPTTNIKIDPSTGQKVILKGKNPDVPVTEAIFQSFYDAPGGFREELREFNISAGAQYEYNKTFAFRLGYFYEDITKGARQYFTLGIGLRYSVGQLDISYLIPTSRINNPLQNTFRFSLGFYLSKDKEKNENTSGNP